MNLRATTLDEKVCLDRHGITPAYRLNLGCGEDWMEEAINIDCRNLLPPDEVAFLRADVSDLSDMFADGCVYEIFAKDVLEHFPQQEIGRVLDEWVRLLGPGGVLHIKCPNLYALALFILQGNESDETKAYRVYGAQTYPENFHKAGLSIGLLSAMLEARGLEILGAETLQETNMLLHARKPTERRHADGNGSR